MAASPAAASAEEKTMLVQSYLFFDGCCEEAVDFYRSALGAELEMLMRYQDAPDPPAPGMIPAGWGGKVMHCSFKIGQTQVMASDSRATDGGGYRGFSLSIATHDAARAAQVFKALAEGGQVAMPLGPTFWSPGFGMLTDRFGVSWMVNTLPAEGSAS